MIESQQFKGYFYLPEDSSNQLPGFLKYDKNDGIKLDLFGQFDKYISPSSQQDNIILGYTSKGKKITLLNCFERSRGMSLPGFAESTFSAIYMFIGQHYTSSEEILFESCSIEYSDFNSWLDISGFNKVERDIKNKEIIIKYKQPQNISFELLDNWQGEIDFYFSSPQFSIPTHKASIEQIPYLNLTPLKIANFKEFREMYSIFNSFLALAYYGFPIIKSIAFTETKIKVQESDSGFNRVDLYTKSGIKHKKYGRHTNDQDFFLQYKPYETRFPIFIKQWYALFYKIEASINILTECFMNRGNPIESHFLTLVQALESMHRRIIGKPKDTLNQRLNEIINNLPDKVKNALLYNEPEFTKRVTESRNFYTHYKEGHEVNAASLSELFLLSEKLKIILMTSILKELTFSDEEAGDLIINKGVWLFNHVIEYQKVKSQLNLH